MSEQQITELKPPRPKDPRRVEAGKRLAAMSRQAKERKKLEREQDVISNECSNTFNTLIVAAVCAVGGGILIYQYYTEQTRTQNNNLTKHQSQGKAQIEDPLH